MQLDFNSVDGLLIQWIRGVYLAGAPNENIFQNHLNIALLNVF